ncbi:hypothetical protein GLYMA_08G300500v4 [Glycine max]|uniref:Uncharacterized protein n=1 Tax=Glycine max TaxID=3847 RepID=K7L9T6_SOYBN|nr:protein PHYTOCHROME KINASE SUBSTRATE 1 [Glycine max]KAG5017368.1 hypothetical protein JHK85_023504 [Glycine max]KAG5027118.1 hypothetical protein JHK86_023032 [Glycine max]KAH1053832.1 hypothetical protein GYH30_022870 [Glycine max]KRH45905.1 hypothetical protein GLYMA_08G300500v4 [Glycine max]|eukprot:XP_003530697.1 protein PHYTOCHROME KINASE SUBSTRATE 1 [Glycine max]
MVNTISSTTNSNFYHQLHTFNYDDSNNNHLYDATFSPYLNGNNEGTTIVGRLGEPSQKLNPLKSPLQKLEKKEENGEIGVFGAEKYFNVEVETPRSTTSSIATPKYLHRQRDEPMAIIATRKHGLPYGTPSIRSESTTCNSQSALLQSGMMMRNSLRNKKDNNKKGHQAKSVLAGLSFKCSCSDKDSVDAGEISFSKPATYGAVHDKKTRRKLVDIAALDASHSIKISKPNAELLKINNVYFQTQEGTFGNRQKSSLAFSSLSSASGNQNHILVTKMQQQQLDEVVEAEKPRNSIEVFGSPTILKNKLKSLSFDRTTTRFAMASSRDGTPRLLLEEIDHSNYINDAASDASSDLFEIESIKSKTNPFLARQTSDAAASSCVSPTNGYAPSEASIEWSVATASAAVMSDCEEQMSEVTIRSPIRTTTKTTFANGKAKSTTKEVQRIRRPSMLLGCKNHKSVRVAGDAYITYENPSSTPKLRSRTNSSSQVARFPSETKLGNFGAKHGQHHHHAYATPSPLQHSHSPHASKLLYI